MKREIKTKLEIINNFNYRGIEINIYKGCKKKKINSCKSDIEDSLDKLPSNIFTRLKERNLQVHVLPQKYLYLSYPIAYPQMIKEEIIQRKKKDSNSKNIGRFMWGTNCVIVTDKFNEYTLLHEIGHFLSNKLTAPVSYYKLKKIASEVDAVGDIVKEQYYIISNDSFRNIYSSEKKYYWYNFYFKKNIIEYFAESFSRYIKEDKKFLRKCPRTVEYIEEFIKSI